jgi:hypothetical protein
MIAFGHDSTCGVVNVDEGGMCRIGGGSFCEEECEGCLWATLHVAVIYNICFDNIPTCDVVRIT